MKLYWKITGIIAVVVIVGALAVGATVFAQGPENYLGFMGRGFGMMGAQGNGNFDHETMQAQMESYMGFDMDSMEETMHPAIAEALGMSESDFEAEMDAGKTMFDIAAERGIDTNTVWDTMQTARADALKQAVADGTITQEQADWMSQMGNHGAEMMGGGMHGRGGMMGDDDFRGMYGNGDFDGTTGPGSMMGGWNNRNTQVQ